ncbi:MAG: YheT family hydrolase [Candidatus Xenobia bacterium]
MAAGPLIQPCSYVAPRLLRNGHLQTVYPTLFRPMPKVHYVRERIETPDGDFLDLDWAAHDRDRVVVLSHGLEGSSDGKYIRGMARAFNRAGWDAVAWNQRSCSGELNRTERFYHSGVTEDLGTVVQHVLQTRTPKAVALVGFSLGGNQTLRYVGERGEAIDRRIAAAVAFSVACDLASSSRRLEDWDNLIYMLRFMESLRRKVQEKSRRFPQRLRPYSLLQVRTFKAFDDRYTAPLHGYASAEDYWERASARPLLHQVRIPTLLVNARNDPFLAPPSFPHEIARDHPHFHLETPEHGGHGGFISFNHEGTYWSERRAVAFVQGNT